jgi:hypothetical protein
VPCLRCVAVDGIPVEYDRDAALLQSLNQFTNGAITGQESFPRNRGFQILQRHDHELGYIRDDVADGYS